MGKVNKIDYKSIQEAYEYVDNYNRKHKQGFTYSELIDVLSNIEGISMPHVEDAMTGNTGMVIDGDFISYTCDVKKAIQCGLEKRQLNVEEWD